MNRPYTFINVAATADGKIDSYERRGSLISSAEDKERVDELRASADAILVGGKTLLEEDPKLVVKSEARRAERVRQGRSPNPIKVGVVTRARLRADSDFLQFGEARRVIFTTAQTSISAVGALRGFGVETFIDDAPRVDLPKMARTLKDLGVARLMVEGGGTLNFELMRLGLVDELLIYVAPLLFGGANAPTLADGFGLAARVALHPRLADVTRLGEGVLLKYLFT